MTRAQLEHAIRAACDVADDTDLLVFGSQAILGEHPNAPPGLRTSIEVDVQPLNNPQAVEAIDGVLGELSMFHQTHGFYVHGVSIEAATLPTGWETRTIKVSDPDGTRGNVGHCLESHDLEELAKVLGFRRAAFACARKSSVQENLAAFAHKWYFSCTRKHHDNENHDYGNRGLQ